MTQQDWRAKTALLNYRLSKFNPNHDEAGRFSSGPGGGGGGGAAPKGGGKRARSRKVLDDIFQKWGRGESDKWESYGAAFTMLNNRETTLADIIDAASKIGIEPGVTKMRRSHDLVTGEFSGRRSPSREKEAAAASKKANRAKRRKNPYPGGRNLKAWRASGMWD